ncbi:hypothetical protein EIN_025090, partial [Entamoeba invadens IP1]|uniref:hypothetical protein n=1 Tax=Entamoeba invadens IP1 TaxID=370355 RepID=UPI0002C3ECEE
FQGRVEETTFRKLGSKPKYDIYIDKNLVTWVDGKKFFPIGAYMNDLNQFDIDHFNDSPFNLMKVGGHSNKKALDDLYEKTHGKIRALNPMANMYCGTNQTLKNNYLATMKALIEDTQTSKGLFGHYITDEPGASCAPMMKEVTRMIREIDRQHVSWPTINLRFNYDIFKEGFDCVGIDDYPVQTFDSLQSIWVMVTQGRKKMMNSRAMWAVPQIFDWTVYNDSYNLDWSKEFPPTYDQLRNMVYQFIASGAMGVVYYDYTEMKVMDYKHPFEKEWTKVKDVTYELRDKFSDIILCVEDPINTDYKIPVNLGLDFTNYVSTRQWSCNGSDYILVVNVRNVLYNYTFYKPNKSYCLEQLMGNGTATTINGTSISLKMDRMDVFWFRGYKSKKSECDEIINLSSTNGIYVLMAMALFMILL